MRLVTGTPQTRSGREARFPRYEGARLVPRECEERFLLDDDRRGCAARELLGRG